MLVEDARAAVISPWLLGAGIFFSDYYGDLAAVKPNTQITSEGQAAILVNYEHLDRRGHELVGIVLARSPCRRTVGILVVCGLRSAN